MNNLLVECEKLLNDERQKQIDNDIISVQFVDETISAQQSYRAELVSRIMRVATPEWLLNHYGFGKGERLVITPKCKDECRARGMWSSDLSFATAATLDGLRMYDDLKVYGEVWLIGGSQRTHVTLSLETLKTMKVR